KKHVKTLDKIKHRPILGTIPWSDIEKLFLFLGAEIEQREGSRVAVILKGSVHVFHEPHPERVTDKGAVASVKACLSSHFPGLFLSKK
ncbi:type II toxin-antitoxin system HicA family toxin, partial [Vibrio alginolyticus]|nr:addiction module toxin, HicA family [Vibrio parahaemolyticus]ELA7934963.1 type II toxin-antitoxin system HicA family toxin [Vibrio parahaemolyticus]HCE3304463.1 type II toxin-antitoxin system HicA family toxin [Vibrio parahaemolyticus]HCG5564247.1 type II toxin-antitoxin system HicA family toxin [Vibrio parahaemolyticus]HCG7110696.1 type II toxin-antitoxin system HicA family toxin [Vibrio parahaemolyticus]